MLLLRCSLAFVAVLVLLATAHAADGSTSDSSAVKELLAEDNAASKGGSNSTDWYGKLLKMPDPYDESAIPKKFNTPSKRRRQHAEKIRNSIVRRIAKEIREQEAKRRKLEMLGPLPSHKRPAELDANNPYRSVADRAYYRFVQSVLHLRNLAVATGDFGSSSGITEFFEPSNPDPNSNTTLPPPSPIVRVCPPKWRLGEKKCNSTGKFCFNSKECTDTECCFDGCKLKCLESELLIRHVCTDYMNNTVYPGDVFMRKRTSICTCDDLGRPVDCKYKKECIDVISSALFQLGELNEKTAKFKRVKNQRQKLYDVLNAAFQHVKKVY